MYIIAAFPISTWDENVLFLQTFCDFPGSVIMKKREKLRSKEVYAHYGFLLGKK